MRRRFFSCLTFHVLWYCQQAVDCKYRVLPLPGQLTIKTVTVRSQPAPHYIQNRFGGNPHGPLKVESDRTMVRDRQRWKMCIVLPYRQKEPHFRGSDRLRRPVSWACSLRPQPPAFPNLTGNGLVLIDMDDLAPLDSRMRLDRAAQSLRPARVAAVAVRGAVDDNAIAAAEQEGVPLPSARKCLADGDRAHHYPAHCRPGGIRGSPGRGFAAQS